MADLHGRLVVQVNLGTAVYVVAGVSLATVAARRPILKGLRQVLRKLGQVIKPHSSAPASYDFENAGTVQFMGRTGDDNTGTPATTVKALERLSQEGPMLLGTSPGHEHNTGQGLVVSKNETEEGEEREEGEEKWEWEARQWEEWEEQWEGEWKEREEGKEKWEWEARQWEEWEEEWNEREKGEEKWEWEARQWKGWEEEWEWEARQRKGWEEEGGRGGRGRRGGRGGHGGHGGRGGDGGYGEYGGGGYRGDGGYGGYGGGGYRGDGGYGEYGGGGGYRGDGEGEEERERRGRQWEEESEQHQEEWPHGYADNRGYGGNYGDYLDEGDLEELLRQMREAGYASNPGDYANERGFQQVLDESFENDNSPGGAKPAAKAAVDSLSSIPIEGRHLDDGSAVCTICQEIVALGDSAKQMPCLHLYHNDCILPWLITHNACPVCRYELPTEVPEHDELPAEDPDHEEQRLNGRQEIPAE